MAYEITKGERKYFFYGIAMIFLWFVYVKDAIAPYLSGMYIPLAALIYDFGLLAGLYLVSKPIKKSGGFKLGLVGYSMMAGMDVVEAPFLVTKAGTYSQAVEYWFVSKDVAVAEIGKTIGVSQPDLWFFTYIIGASVLIMLIPAIVASEKQIRGHVA